jgi:hypothetical protein
LLSSSSKVKLGVFSFPTAPFVPYDVMSPKGTGRIKKVSDVPPVFKVAPDLTAPGMMSPLVPPPATVVSPKAKAVVPKLKATSKAEAMAAKAIASESLSPAALPPSPPTRSGLTTNSVPPLKKPRKSELASVEPGLAFDFLHLAAGSRTELASSDENPPLKKVRRSEAAPPAELAGAPVTPLCAPPLKKVRRSAAASLAQLAARALAANAPVTPVAHPHPTKRPRVAAGSPAELASPSVDTDVPATPLPEPPSETIPRAAAPPPSAPVQIAASTSSSSSSGCAAAGVPAPFLGGFSTSSTPAELLKLLGAAANLNHLNLADVLRAAGFVSEASIPPATPASASTTASDSSSET